MFELTINNTVYPFNFGLGFVRAISSKMVRTVDGVKQEVGLQCAVASLIDENPVELVEILALANKTEAPRITKADLDAYIEDESTDLEALFAELLDFLKNANATRKIAAAVTEMVEAEMAKAKAAE